MLVAVAAERAPGETRVALVPELVARLRELGADVLVEPGAGSAAGFVDQAYRAAGAQVGPDVLGTADLVLGVQPLPATVLADLKPGAVTISFFDGPDRPERIAVLTERGLRAYAMEQVPRISRAQPMDALTSQALVTGYRAVVVAAELSPVAFSASVTAAGTLPAAEVLVLGSGVVGLQAIATARRLGASVSGYDVRVSSAEEIGSLGATALDLGLPPLEGPAGYARELDRDQAAALHRQLGPYVARADVVIATAAVPGRVAPVLVTDAMLAGMRPGSVVVDVAADFGGNVEGVRPGELVHRHGVRLWGGSNVPAQMPVMASALYARNVVHLVALVLGTGAGSGGAVGEPEDEILAGALVRP